MAVAIDFEALMKAELELQKASAPAEASSSGRTAVLPSEGAVESEAAVNEFPTIDVHLAPCKHVLDRLEVAKLNGCRHRRPVL